MAGRVPVPAALCPAIHWAVTGLAAGFGMPPRRKLVEFRGPLIESFAGISIWRSGTG
jgi:hypothetical protein